MKLIDIMNVPQTVGGNHESLYRSYHILQLVKNWLNDGVPSKVILETIYELESCKKEE